MCIRDRAISHAQAASVPIVFAINKIDKPNSNPDKIKESLSNMNLLVEDWGGKIQSHDISALKGDGVNELLEKVLLEATRNSAIFIFFSLRLIGFNCDSKC